jgi:nitrate reductase NapE component
MAKKPKKSSSSMDTFWVFILIVIFVLIAAKGGAEGFMTWINQVIA